MAVTGGGGGLVAGCRSPFGKVGHRWEGCVPGRRGRAKSVGIGTDLSPSCRIRHKKENVQRRSFFVRSGRGRHSFPREAPAVAAACDFWRCARCSLLWGSGGDQHPDQRKVFSGWGESARGGGTVFTKNVPPPLVQNSVVETIRRRRRSRRRRRDWRRFRQGGPDGRLPACAGGCPGGGCIRSRRCAPDGGRR